MSDQVPKMEVSHVVWVRDKVMVLGPDEFEVCPLCGERIPKGSLANHGKARAKDGKEDHVVLQVMES